MPQRPSTANTNPEAKIAAHGEKMIELKVRFWTDGISGVPGKVLPKHAWTSGVVRIERNAAHGIKPAEAVPFNSLLDVGAAIEKVLIRNGITLHPNRKMRRYIVRPPKGE